MFKVLRFVGLRHKTLNFVKSHESDRVSHVIRQLAGTSDSVTCSSSHWTVGLKPRSIENILFSNFGGKFEIFQKVSNSKVCESSKFLHC